MGNEESSIAVERRGPVAVVALNRPEALNAFTLPMVAGLDAMRAAFAEADEATWVAVKRPDAAEGVASYLERRPPRFTPIGEGGPA